jgi:hypothetical protein
MVKRVGEGPLLFVRCRECLSKMHKSCLLQSGNVLSQGQGALFYMVSPAASEVRSALKHSNRASRCSSKS